VAPPLYMQSDDNRNVVMRRISVLYQVCGGRDVTRVLTHYALRMLVCIDTASLQRLSPVAVICLKKLFREVADSVITPVLLQAELVTQLLHRTDGNVCYRFRRQGDLTTKLSKMCIRKIKVCRFYDNSSVENHVLLL
jgi:hypothetical protein